MKRNILLSINPEHVENIINGTKKFEYRKILAKGEISKIIIYETRPTKKIVAEVEILELIIKSPKELWNATKDSSGISKLFFDEYFKDKEKACAYKLGDIKVFKKPKELASYGVKSAPQSFLYLS